MTYSNYYWLNDESRKFLSRGYITESPEQRIKDIARTAEKYLGIHGFAQKFEDYMAKVTIVFLHQYGLTLVSKKVYLSVVMDLT